MTDVLEIPSRDEGSTTEIAEKIATMPGKTVIEKTATFLKWNYGAVLVGQRDSDWLREAETLFMLFGLFEVTRAH